MWSGFDFRYLNFSGQFLFLKLISLDRARDMTSSTTLVVLCSADWYIVLRGLSLQALAATMWQIALVLLLTPFMGTVFFKWSVEDIQRVRG